MPRDEQHSHDLGSSSQASPQGLPDSSPSEESNALQSLAPMYSPEHHEIYVKHLQRAVEDERNRNIALTGHYGTGKSSILDEFLALQEGDSINAIRISISTLGSASNENLSNHLQKELVKQLIYRSRPGEVKTSRFARSKDFKPSTALKDSIIPSALICWFFWLFDAFPHASSIAQVSPYLSMLALFIAVTASVWWGRWVIGDKFISTLSAAGTSISFASETRSYFDEYLEEIITYFEATGVDLVVFEDIDRFDEPRIFDSLRELNTLINAATAWKRDTPIRFIYAIKDSLFANLYSPGSLKTANKDSVLTRTDPTHKELIRANRTKFFDLIIPVVPFLSQTNSRDHLAHLVGRLSFPDGDTVSRTLINLVGQHVTDMRLMQNICNEFVVFAERLLWIDKHRRTPEINADRLFAIVVYKNFHLADFEKVAQRRSQLDRLERFRKDIIYENIRLLEKKKSEAQKAKAFIETQDNMAITKSALLWAAFETSDFTLEDISINGRTCDRRSTEEVAFWLKLKDSSDVSFRVLRPHVSSPQFWTLEDLKSQFPNAIDEDWISSLPSCYDNSAIGKFTHEISDLRGASYLFLLRHKEYGGDDACFEKRLTECLGSKLSRDLVKQGFLDRYYAEYSSVFYGEFLGIEVANFFRNSVWPNEMDIYAHFPTTTALNNILDQAPPEFTQTRSVLNIDIVDYLVDTRTNEAKKVALFIAESEDEGTQAFLTAFLNSPSEQRLEFVRLLAQTPWLKLLAFLTTADYVNSVPDAIRFVDAAIMAARTAEGFEITDGVSEFFDAHYAKMSAMTGHLKPAQEEVIWGLISKMQFSASDLAPVAPALKRRLIKTGKYRFSIANLRVILDLKEDEFPTLDSILKLEFVHKKAIDNIHVYLKEAIESYPTEVIVNDLSILWSPLEDDDPDLDTESIRTLVKHSNPTSCIRYLHEAAETSWPILAEFRRFTPSADNLAEYANKFGVDKFLSRLLIGDSGEPIDITEVDATIDINGKMFLSLAVAILNCQEWLTINQRVALVSQVMDQADIEYLPPEEVKVFDSDLLSVSLNNSIFPDSEATFRRFLSFGWEAIGSAFTSSENARSFLTPELLGDHTDQFLHDDLVPDELKICVISDLRSYFSNKIGNEKSLARATKLAHELHIEMDLPEIEWAATLQVEPEDILWQLSRLIASGQEPSATEVMKILGSLGRDWIGFDKSSGHEFSVGRSDSLKPVLNYLRDKNLIHLPRGGKQGTKKIQIV